MWFHSLETLIVFSLLGGLLVVSLVVSLLGDIDYGFITWRHWLVALIKVALFGGIDKNKDIL